MSIKKFAISENGDENRIFSLYKRIYMWYKNIWKLLVDIIRRHSGVDIPDCENIIFNGSKHRWQLIINEKSKNCR